MNKKELIAHIASNADITNRAAAAALDAVISGITSTLKSNSKVQLVGFGSFEVKTRAARTYLNPRTGEPVETPETRIASFKVGKALKEAVK